MKITKLFLVFAMTLGATAQAQTNVISRTTPAVNYGHRHSSTQIDFRGTDLMPAANGHADVRTDRGVMEVKVEFGELQNPVTFGNEYLTYVLWAISPEGRPANLGEVLVGDNHRSKLDVTTNLQAFAMIVTAEPYYAVRRPSNVVVLENVTTAETNGTTEAVDAKYELIGRGGYIPSGYTFDPVVLNAKLPLEFFEARNAVRIAHSEGAEQYASESYENAVRQMKEADGLATARHVEKKALISVSREVVQTAEDATEISMKRREDDRVNAEKRAAEGRERDAKAQSQQDMQARQNAEAQTADAVRQRAQAESAAADANAQRTQAENAAADANSKRATAEQATADAQLQQQAAQADSDRNRAAAAASDQQLQQALKDREALRASLLLQFNAILATRDTARGLVVNMSDVLFDTGKYTLRPLAREKLAKISGIVLAYPSLLLAIEGDTDSVGSDSYNQDLSEKRAEAVRDYLGKQSIPMASMTAQGFGKTQPVASNDTAEGRQQNRRVELVVSGDVIGTTIGVVSQNRE
ncbi:MAG TPA: OmpA family protein [Candidatus Acidoferrales bacterium]|nr:OmpA family protein [Candidatus Acidoferrales bacterium]